MKPVILTILSALSLAANLFAAEPAMVTAPETPKDHAARMEWWREAKFGLFIHWGPYCVPAGFYHDKPVTGVGEWIMCYAKIPMAEYQQFAKGFNPLKALAAACHKHGVRLGFYYSQAQDWNNGGSSSGKKWDQAQEHDMDDYIDKVAVPQVKEICANYGEFPDIIWWDTERNMNANRAQKLYDAVHALRWSVESGVTLV